MLLFSDLKPYALGNQDRSLSLVQLLHRYWNVPETSHHAGTLQVSDECTPTSQPYGVLPFFLGKALSFGLGECFWRKCIDRSLQSVFAEANFLCSSCLQQQCENWLSCLIHLLGIEVVLIIWWEGLVSPLVVLLSGRGMCTYIPSIKG